jgi:hypothetical protein
VGLSNKRKDGVVLGRWQVVVTIILAVTAFFGGKYFGSHESYEQLEHWRTEAQYWQKQSQQAQRALEYSMEPKCDLEFVHGSTSRSTSPYFLLTNHGPGPLDNVWLKETVFLLDKEGVHECSNFPHFEYKRYNGSASSMGSLDIGGERRIEVDNCLLRAVEILFQKYSGTLVSRFRLTGSALASPEFRRDFFFVFDEKALEWGVPTYVVPHEHVGGSDLVDSVTTYVNDGPESLIELISIQDFHEFFKNPPGTFYKTKDGRFLPYDSTTHVPSGTPLVPRVRLVESVGSGSLKLGWRCDDEVGPIFLNFVSQPGIW